MSSDIVVAAKDPPAAKPADVLEPHYTDLNERMTEQLRNFRMAGEALGFLLVENIKFNRDRLSEFFDKFESISESLPDVDAVLKACDDLEGFKKKLGDSLTETEIRLVGQVTALSRTVDGLVATQQERVQREAVVPVVDFTTVNNTVNMVRDQVVDLNNRFSALYDRIGMIEQGHTDSVRNLQNQISAQGQISANTDVRVARIPENAAAQLSSLSARIASLETRQTSGQTNEGGAA